MIMIEIGNYIFPINGIMYIKFIKKKMYYTVYVYLYKQDFPIGVDDIPKEYLNNIVKRLELVGEK